MNIISLFLFIICSYLLGAIPFGYLAGRLRGIDLREHGSCNIGATNAIRVLGKKIGLSVFFCDALKGFLPVYLWMMWINGVDAGGAEVDVSWFSVIGLVCVAFATILGHTYTCFLHFKGGKGVASTGGVLFAISPLICGIAFVVWFILLFVTRYVPVPCRGGAVAMIIAAMYRFDFFAMDGWRIRPEWVILVFLTLIALLVIYKHKSNIVRLLHGEEPQIKMFQKKKS
ncbi:MAG: glycerol-3-phosphate 1-O-acyltransferase PlsY [Akkermansia sp.]